MFTRINLDKPQILNFVFIIIFLICLVIPNFHFSSDGISEQENRTLAKYSPLFNNDGGGYNLNYGADFEKFYNDRFFCRKELISFNDDVQKLFSFNPNQLLKNKSVLQGKDDWLFFRGNDSEINFLNFSLFDDSELLQGLKYLIDIKNWCSANGKLFVFMICPDKNKIYGEFFPDEYKKVRPDYESRAVQFVKLIRANSNVDIIYPYDELIAEKENGGLLYYKNDSHWSPEGAYIGYKKLMETIKTELDIDEVLPNGFEESTYPNGDMNIYFPATKFINENTVYRNPQINSSFEKISNENEALAFKDIIVKTDRKDKKYNAIFFRDSFATNMIDYISSTFGKVVYYWRYNITPEDLEYIKDNIDVVVLECVERFLPDIVKQTFPEIN